MKNEPFIGKRNSFNGQSLVPSYINEWPNRKERRLHLHNSSGSMKSIMSVFPTGKIMFYVQFVTDKKTGETKRIKHAIA